MTTKLSREEERRVEALQAAALILSMSEADVYSFEVLAMAEEFTRFIKSGQR